MKHSAIDTSLSQKSEHEVFHDGAIERLLPLEAENREFVARLFSQSNFTRRFPIIEQHLGVWS